MVRRCDVLGVGDKNPWLVSSTAVTLRSNWQEAEALRTTCLLSRNVGCRQVDGIEYHFQIQCRNLQNFPPLPI